MFCMTSESVVVGCRAARNEERGVLSQAAKRRIWCSCLRKDGNILISRQQEEKGFARFSNSMLASRPCFLMSLFVCIQTMLSVARNSAVLCGVLRGCTVVARVLMGRRLTPSVWQFEAGRTVTWMNVALASHDR